MTPPVTLREMLAQSAGLQGCPICRGVARYTEDGPMRAIPKLEHIADDYGGGWRVICYGCMIMAVGLTRDEAINLWNRRPQPVVDMADIE
jgi:hypothetical protein